ncbi:MAG: D-TA family PLP-dependent enzyme [Planctomycetaceae bacterium]|nr:D-TA family PLP-dependent enzyme [Planctomycetaceae bacterium]
MSPPYHIHHPDQILSPQLVVFRPLVRKNLETMIQIAGKPDRLRPHCKTHKMPAVAKMVEDLGVHKHKAATFAEVEMLAEVGARDIFLAYNMVGPSVQRAANCLKKYPGMKLSVTADDPTWIARLGEAMVDAGAEIGVVLDINPGRDRTGVPVGRSAEALYQQIAETSGLRPEGLHLYDGHQHQRDLAERVAAVEQEWQKVRMFVDGLKRRGFLIPRVICGGTPTFPVYARMDDPLIELSPGTCIFHDAGYNENFPDLDVFTPAALIFTRVVSRPTENRVTLDCGTKAVASDPPMGSRVVLPGIPDGKQVLQNEEHLVVETTEADQFRPGDWMLAIPRHVCPGTALYQEAVVIDDGDIVDRWPVVARDRYLTI